MKHDLYKKIFTDTDYDQMCWHDCTIYKVRLADDLEMDIDYIVEWVEPEADGFPFSFWVAPATLVFKKVRNVTFEFDAIMQGETIEIEEIEMEHTDEGISWTITTRQGEMQFIADGFEQYMRQEPFFRLAQSIAISERNGISLDRTTNQPNPYRTLV